MDDRRRVTLGQLEVLWEFLSSHRDIAVGYNKTTQARAHSRAMWENVASSLNSIGDGAYKDWKGWAKYWTDYKSKLKKRVQKVRSSLNRTGGGPASEMPLDDIEQKFLLILGEDYGMGIPGVQIDPFQNENEESGSEQQNLDEASEESAVLLVVGEEDLESSVIFSPRNRSRVSPQNSQAIQNQQVTQNTQASQNPHPTQNSQATQNTQVSQNPQPTQNSQATQNTQASQNPQPTRNSQVTQNTQASQNPQPTRNSQVTQNTSTSSPAHPNVTSPQRPHEIDETDPVRPRRPRPNPDQRPRQRIRPRRQPIYTAEKARLDLVQIARDRSAIFSQMLSVFTRIENRLQRAFPTDSNL